MSIKCLVCENSEFLEFKKWNDYEIYICPKCDLNFCLKMVEKEVGGDSSPVDESGTLMMEESFHKTKNLAKKIFNKRIIFYENIMQRKCKSILEVGCGPGTFFEQAKNKSIKWEGLEINPFWIDFGKNNQIPISNKKINRLNKKYDLITAHQVLEHVEEPRLFLKSIYERLNPGGIVHFELPNNFSFTSSIRKISPNFSYDYGFIQPPMHLRAYSKKTLKTLFNLYNLKIVQIFTCSNNNAIWGQVRDYKIYQKLFYGFTGLVGRGSLLIGIAKKNNV